MPLCPHCRTGLRTVRQREGLFYYCPICHGRAVTLPQIRRVAGDRCATSLLRRINQSTGPGGAHCPFCAMAMRRVFAAEPPLELDSCKPCGVVWFDANEFETLPEGAIESPDAARLRGIEVLATHKLEAMKPQGVTDDAPDADWKTIPALFGLPVESGINPLSRHPWLTWSLALAIAAISIVAFFHLTTAVGRYGFVPAEAWRLGGATWLTSFFLHGDLWHLVGNLYFLLIFGDNVEDCLGRGRYVLLLLTATLTGNALHWLVAPHSTIPCIGASGGISGVIVFYALQYPRARLGILLRYFFYFRWVQFPAWVALVLWLLLQMLTAVLQVSGFSHVGATAHLGGAVAGLVLWWRWRARRF